jgi:hypothetical protein
MVYPWCDSGFTGPSSVSPSSLFPSSPGTPTQLSQCRHNVVTMLLSYYCTIDTGVGAFPSGPKPLLREASLGSYERVVMIYL